MCLPFHAKGTTAFQSNYSAKNDDKSGTMTDYPVTNHETTRNNDHVPITRSASVDTSSISHSQVNPRKVRS